jgi:hypothetical protein
VFNCHVALGRLNGAVESARQYHDKAIGLGRVFHLFRLPEIMEQDISEALQAAPPELPQSAQDARAVLETYGAGNSEIAAGPIKTGSVLSITDTQHIALIARAYRLSLERGAPTLPYFSE